jgi:hypothetical protein
MKKSFSLIIIAILFTSITGIAQNASIDKKNLNDFRALKSQLLASEDASINQSSFYKNTGTTRQDFGNAPDWDWGKSFAGSGRDIINDAVVDELGNIYVIGSFSGTTDLMGTPRVSVGKRDLFVAKYDADGNLVWLEQGSCGEFNSSEAYDIKLIDDMLLITGYFDGPSLTIDESSTNLIGYSDALILKMTTEGSIEMMEGFGVSGFLYRGLAIDQDNEQNIYLTGTTDGNTSYYHQSFLAKLSPVGSMLWWQEHNAGFNDLVISGDELFIGGTAFVETWLDNILLDPVGYNDAFVAKANLDGQYAWAIMGDHTSVPWGDSFMPRLADAGDENIYIAGYYRRNVEFGGILLSTNSIMDVFVFKVNPEGDVLWAKSTKTGNQLDGFTALGNGNICISGGMFSTATFDDIVLENPNPGTGYYAAIYNSDGEAQNAFLLEQQSHNLASLPADGLLQVGTTSLDAYFAIYDDSGNLSAQKLSSGNSGTAQLTGLEVDETGVIYSLSNLYGYSEFFGVDILNEKETMVLTAQKPNGDVLWIEKMVGGTSWWNFTETALKLDQLHDKLFLHGLYNDTLTIGNLEFINPVPEERRSFIACYSKAGEFYWAKEIPYYADIQSVDTDAAGNAYFIFDFWGTIEIEGQTFTSHGDGDALILKYSGDGTFIYAKQIKTDVFFYQMSLATIQSGGYFITLEPAADSIYFNNGNNTMTFTPNDGRCVVAKYTDSGDYLWAKSFGYSPANYGGFYCWPTATVTDDEGNLYLTGSHGDSAQFDNITLTTPYNRHSPFAAKIDTDGNALWANSIQIHRWGNNYCEAEIDGEGNFYCMGHAPDTIHFGDWQYIPSGPNDMYVVRYDNDGELNWVKTIESTSSANKLFGMGVFDANNLFVGGHFANQIYSDDMELRTSSSMAGFTIHIGDTIEYTSINEENLAEIFVVAYPNPATDLLYLDFKTQAQKAYVDVMDINGRLLKTITFANPSGTEKLDVSALPKGMCLVKITADGMSATRKVMIQ